MEWFTGLKKHGNYYSGFVERLNPVLESHRIATTTTWGTRTSTAHSARGSTNLGGKKRGLTEGKAEGYTCAKRAKGDGDHDKENDSAMVEVLICKPLVVYLIFPFYTHL